jgi:predicted SAM-dependent methyltransferase
MKPSFGKKLLGALFPNGAQQESPQPQPQKSPKATAATAAQPPPRIEVGSKRLLNLGCGALFHPDWVNVDIKSRDPLVIEHDLQTPLPFADNTFQAVYHSHVLEHLSRNQAPPFLRECVRVLAPGGVLRVAVPNLENIVRLYIKYLDQALAGDEQAAKNHEWMTLELLDQMVRESSGGAIKEYWQQNPMPAEELVLARAGKEVRNFLDTFRSAAAPEPPPQASEPTDVAKIAKFRQRGEIHRWMYDRFSLGQLLAKIGLREVKVCAANQSRIPDFNRFLLDTNPDGTVRKPDSLFMEGVKAE